MNKGLRTTVLVITLIIIVILNVIALKEAFTPDLPENVTWETHIVEPGETLWWLVPHDNNYDVRNIVQMTEEHNNLHGYLMAGDIIELPTWDY